MQDIELMAEQIALGRWQARRGMGAMSGVTATSRRGQSHLRPGAPRVLGQNEIDSLLGFGDV
jgi:hypothetical protein